MSKLTLSHLHRPTRRWFFIIVAVVMLSLVATIWLNQDAEVQAKSNFMTNFRSTYPATVGTQLDSCTVCHTNIPSINAYGDDYRSHGHNLIAIELLDSDGDGYTNLQEIQALTFPGDAGSYPVTQPTTTPTSPSPTSTPTTSPGFTPTATPTQPGVTPTVTVGEYELIGWNDLGMHCMNESFENVAILPPYNNLWAQLVRKGSDPEIVTDNIIIEYSFQNNTTSADKIDFWDYVDQLFGVSLAPNIGLTGEGMAGTMHAKGDHFIVEGVPLTPYEDGQPHVAQPYQLADLVAKDATTGEVLASTTFVAPVSTEMHCDDCHSDGQQEDIATGNVETNILALHDEEEDTNLMGQRPVLCANCHASNALGMPGNPYLPSLSRAIHDKHADDDDDDDDSNPLHADNVAASLLPNDDDGPEPTCYQCHPGPETACLRGTMAAAGMTCESCHGTLSDVASEAREPWVDLPLCGDCHGPDYAENPGKLFRESIGHGGFYCESCHGSTHAILPSTEPRDNIQVIRLQGWAGTLTDCQVCHGNDVPDGPGPHGMANPNPATPTPQSPTPTATLTPTETREPTGTPENNRAYLPMIIQ